MNRFSVETTGAMLAVALGCITCAKGAAEPPGPTTELAPSAGAAGAGGANSEPAAGAAGEAPSSRNSATTYLFAYFTGEGEDGLRLAASTDGLTFLPLKQGESLLTPEIGDDPLMRDPSIVRGPDGSFHLVWTSGWWEKSIGYARSADLVHWSEQRAIPVMTHEPAARNAWAPELFYDDEQEQFLIVWASTIPSAFPDTSASSESDLNHRLYFTTTSDFEEFAETALFYDGGFNVIDGFIVRDRDQDRHVLVMKDESLHPEASKELRLAYSESASGPYGPASEPFTTDWVEGPSMVRIGEEYRLFYDEYTRSRYGALSTRDFEEWEDISSAIDFPAGARHGTVFEVTDLVLDDSIPEGFDWL